MRNKATMLLTTILAVGLTASQAMSAQVCGIARNANGDPVAGVPVTVKDASGNVLGQATTGSKGEYQISGLQQGSLDLFGPGGGILPGSGVLDLAGDSRMVNWQVSAASPAVASQDGVCRAGALTGAEWAAIGTLGFLGAGAIAVIVLGATGQFDDNDHHQPVSPLF
jgi:hypothetical protein